jgi:hypothetical protein
MPFRKVVASALAVGAALGVGVPAASASTLPMPDFTLPTAGFLFPGGTPTFPAAPGIAGQSASGNNGGACGASTANPGQLGPVGGTAAAVCLAPGGLSFVGPAIGQISSIVGPTIMGPAVGVTVIQSAGNVGAGG